MAIQKYINSFFRAIRVRKSTVPEASSDHAQIYCDQADGALKVKLPNGEVVVIAEPTP